MRSSPPIAFAALAALTALALAACSGGPGAASAVPSTATVPSASAAPSSASMTPGAPEPTSPLDPSGIDGRTFIGTAASARVVTDATKIRLSFADGRLSGTGGCNSMSGPYKVVDGTLALGPMAGTEMACAEPLMAQDAWLAGFLPGAAVALDSPTLTLRRDGLTLTLTDRTAADPDRPLQGTAWVLDGIVSKDTVSSVPAGVTAGITIEGDTAGVHTGCNTGSGTARVTGTAITFGPIATTAMRCGDAEMHVEQAVLGTLSGEVSYSIEAGTLTLTNGDRGLVFKAAD
jgi:heat shock protein HslJ